MCWKVCVSAGGGGQLIPSAAHARVGGGQCWAAQYKRDWDVLERAQRGDAGGALGRLSKW